jgi:NAD(P)H dehydrogenase (quinone)
MEGVIGVAWLTALEEPALWKKGDAGDRARLISIGRRSRPGGIDSHHGAPSEGRNNAESPPPMGEKIEMKHAVVVAHPSQNSFNLSVAYAYCEAARRLGHTPVLRDLYRMGFDPCLRDGEIPRPGGFKPGDDVLAERAIVADADVFAFIYPLWFNAPPAMLKGYIERVFGMGFGYGPIQAGGNTPLLKGRQLISFSSSGAPTEWVIKEGAWSAIRNLFDDHVAGVCGLISLDHVHFGGVVPGVRTDVVKERLETVAKTVARFF